MRWRHHHPWGGDHHRRRGRMHLQRRLFLWFGASIFITGVVVALTLSGLGRVEGMGRSRLQGAVELLSWQAAQAWTSQEGRAAWAAHLAAGLGWAVQLEDSTHHVLAKYGPRLVRTDLLAPVEAEGALVGYVRVETAPSRDWWKLFLVLFLLFGMLWAAAGRVARGIAWPLAELTRVARALGEGKLSTRAEVHGTAEVRELANVMNEMASRIERQLRDQRELLAGVSHELRTPLARVRLLLELGRSGAETGRTLDEVEGEVVEMDRLVGELLASARMDFAALSRVTLDARDVAARALERAGLPSTLLQVDAVRRTFQGDPTLLGRALANLLENASRHGGGVTALHVSEEGGALVFSVEDAGPGFAAGESAEAFQPFRRGTSSKQGEQAGLGLGLALVRRIAEAHGGQAFAENRPGGGARVGFRVPL